MIKFFLKCKFLLYTFIFSGIFNFAQASILEYNFDAKKISNYFSGIISFDNYNYEVSEKFFKKLNNFEDFNEEYPSRLLHSLINLQKFDEAYRYSLKLDKKKHSIFESNIFIGLYEFKSNNYDKASSYFLKLKPRYNQDIFSEVLKISLNSWVKLAESKNKEDINNINFPNKAFDNLEMIQKTFANCYLSTGQTENYFLSIFENKKFNFSRYNFFMSNFYYNQKQKNKALEIINSGAKKYPTNLLINQFKNVLLNKESNKNIFSCKNSSHVMAEIFYIFANVMSSEGNYRLSNFYIGLAKFLNPSFESYDTLLAENYTTLKKYNEAKKIYQKLFKIGSIYKWYSAKQIAASMEKEDNPNSIKFLTEVYKNIKPGIYETFDFANFLRSNEKYKEAINLYSEILISIDQEQKLYSEILERRGMSYERINEWANAEKDLIRSLKIRPNEPYVMNYLAYSWVEKNINIEEALQMLREANMLQKNSGYITDSLGWALYKIKNFSEAKKYLEYAIVLMPKDPVINDHYADCLWMNNYKIQARYYWNNVLKSDEAEDELKSKVKEKILFGLESS